MGRQNAADGGRRANQSQSEHGIRRLEKRRKGTNVSGGHQNVPHVAAGQTKRRRAQHAVQLAKRNKRT